MRPDAADLVRQLLKKDPNERLGARGNYAALRNHAFFAPLVAMHAAVQGPPLLEMKKEGRVASCAGREGETEPTNATASAGEVIVSLQAADAMPDDASVAFAALRDDPRLDDPGSGGAAQLHPPCLQDLCLNYVVKQLASASCRHGRRIIGTRGWDTVGRLPWPLRAQLCRRLADKSVMLSNRGEKDNESIGVLHVPEVRAGGALRRCGVDVDCAPGGVCAARRSVVPTNARCNAPSVQALSMLFDDGQGGRTAPLQRAQDNELIGLSRREEGNVRHSRLRGCAWVRCSWLRDVGGPVGHE